MRRDIVGRLARWTLAFVASVPLFGCASLVSRASVGLAGDLTSAILNQNDPETVRQGAPAYLLLIDGLIEGEPESEGLLLAGSRLYAAYASAFVSDPARARLLADKARDYGLRSLCRADRRTCGAWQQPFERFAAAISRVDREGIPSLHAAAAAWAAWIQVNSSDFKAVAEKARVEAMMLRIVAVEESYDGGSAHLYLGVLNTLLPPALGGRPDDGRMHFERAIALSEGRNLMAKVLYAKHYARLVFDRELHDRLCDEVLAAAPAAPGLTLVNTLAQAEARSLLAQSSGFFGE